MFIQFLYPLLLKKSRNLYGSVLILSLWVVVLLSVFAVSLSYGVRQKMALVEKLESKRMLACLAESGVKKAISFLLKNNKYEYIGVNSILLNNPQEFKDMEFDRGYVKFYYAYRDDLTADSFYFLGFQDEARKININKADREVLKRLFILLNLDEVKAEEISSSIVDWRDKDNELSSSYSAEDTYYQFLEPGYSAKDNDFEVLDELLLVKGVDKGIFERIKDYLTVYGDGRININTASAKVLLALGLPFSLVEKIIYFRLGEDKIIGTDDDNVFKNTQEIVADLNQRFKLNEAEITQLSRIINDYLCVDSSFFAIESKACRKEKDEAVSVKAVVDKEGQVFYWREL